MVPGLLHSESPAQLDHQLITDRLQVKHLGIVIGSSPQDLKLYLSTRQSVNTNTHVIAVKVIIHKFAAVFIYSHNSCR